MRGAPLEDGNVYFRFCHAPILLALQLHQLLNVLSNRFNVSKKFVTSNWFNHAHYQVHVALTPASHPPCHVVLA